MTPVEVLRANQTLKALTIRQPWAQLIAVGVKHLETRSWRTSYRGPLAIHAGKHRPPRVRDTDAGIEEAGPAALSTDLYAMASSWRWDEYLNGTGDGDYYWVGPLGAVVATANLVDCIPIVDDMTICEPPYVRVFASVAALRVEDDSYLGTQTPITDQLPYGDFTPGRWAWILEDVEPLAEPIPAKGKQGLWTWDQ